MLLTLGGSLLFWYLKADRYNYENCVCLIQLHSHETLVNWMENPVFVHNDSPQSEVELWQVFCQLFAVFFTSLVILCWGNTNTNINTNTSFPSTNITTIINRTTNLRKFLSHLYCCKNHDKTKKTLIKLVALIKWLTIVIKTATQIFKNYIQNKSLM